MRKMNSKTTLIALGVVTAAAIGGSAFAAGITNPNTSGTGAGQASISVAGYNVTNVEYKGAWTGAGTDSTQTVTSVTFNLYQGAGTTVAPTTTKVYIILKPGGSWSAACSVAALGAVTCTPGGTVTLSALTAMDIVAYAP